MKSPVYERESEVQLYVREYENERYGMGDRRKKDVHRILSGIRKKGSLLDVSTGRGETLDMAHRLGFTSVYGTEVVKSLTGGRVKFAYAHELPFADNDFDYVTCFDVLEHLVEDDIRPALAEMWRVARVAVIVSASERPSVFGGRDLHISKRPAADWLKMFREVWGNAERIGMAGGSPAFKGVKP